MADRAPLDQAFAELFTALVDGELLDPRTHSPMPLPQDFRLIGTTNSADRRLLFEFSEALKRRFAFVEVPAFVAQGGMPPRRLGDHARLLAQLRTRPALANLAPEGEGFERSFEAAIHALEPLYARLRLLHPFGLAQALDVLTYVLVAEGHGVESEAEARLFAATCDNLLPALEHLPRSRLEALAAALEGRLGQWLEDFASEAESGYQLDPSASATALELLRALRGSPSAPAPSTPEGWAEACRELRSQASTLHPLDAVTGRVATRLAQTLRALCAGADG